jgi:hypothetical protein
VREAAARDAGRAARPRFRVLNVRTRRRRAPVCLRAAPRRLLDVLDDDRSGTIEFAELIGWYLERMQDYAYAERARKAERSKLRVFWEERLKLSPRARIAVGWAVAWGLFALFAVLSVTYAIQFGEARFNAIIMGWALSLGQTFAAEEPITIWIYLLIPWLIGTVSQNEYASELLNTFMGTAVGEMVGACIGMLTQTEA